MASRHSLGGLGVMLGFALACGGSQDPGFTQVTAGGLLTIEFDGAMQGTITAAPETDAQLDQHVGSYYPKPGYPTPPEGAWLALRSVADAADNDEAWMIQIHIAEVRPLTWSGGCGTPRYDQIGPATVDIWPNDKGGAVVAVSVGLSNGGLASFQGNAPDGMDDAINLTATGTWTLEWCDGNGTKRKVGPGTVHVTFTIDEANRRTWKAVPRGAW